MSGSERPATSHGRADNRYRRPRANGTIHMRDIFDTKQTFGALGLRPEVLSGIAEVGFEYPTHVQSELIPLAISGQDVLGQSRTGTGKTAAFGLPILHLLERGSTRVCTSWRSTGDKESKSRPSGYSGGPRSSSARLGGSWT